MALRSVMSRLVDAAPVIAPELSRMGETLSETHTRLPSLQMRLDS